MFEVVDASEQFAALARRVGVKPAEPDDELFVPDYIKDLVPYAANDDLMANWRDAIPPPDIDELRSALRSFSPEWFQERENWRHKFVAGLAHTVVEYPELKEEIRLLMHEISSQPKAFTGKTFPRGYDARARAANDQEFGNVLAETEKRIALGKSVTTLGTIFEIAKQHGWVRPTPLANAASTAPQPTPESSSPQATPEVAISSMSAFQQGPDETEILSFDQFKFAHGGRTRAKRRPLLGGIYWRGEVTNTSGAGGIAKSTLVTSEEVAVLVGQPLTGEEVYARVNVGCINGEESREEVMLQYQAALDHHQIPISDVEDNLFVIGVEAANHFCLTRVNEKTRQPEINAQALYQLEQFIKKCKLGLLRLDPLVTFCPNGVNDNGIMGTLMGRLKALARKYDCAISLVHHIRKGSSATTDGADSASGAAALINLSRVARGIVSINSSESEDLGILIGEEWRYRAIINTKANRTPRADRKYVELVSVNMQNGTAEYPDPDHVPVAIPYQPLQGQISVPPGQLKDVLNVLATGVDPVTPLSRHSRANGRYAVPHIAGALRPYYPAIAQKDLEARAKALLTKLINGGTIAEVDIRVPKKGKGGGTNQVKGLKVNQSTTQWATGPDLGPHVQ